MALEVGHVVPVDRDHAGSQVAVDTLPVPAANLL